MVRNESKPAHQHVCVKVSLSPRCGRLLAQRDVRRVAADCMKFVYCYPWRYSEKKGRGTADAGKWKTLAGIRV